MRETVEELFKSPIISKLPLKERYKKQIAFTLAEVLITLLIIGIVASLVIPALINDTQKVEYVTKLKKESAVLQQAFKLLALDAGGTILNNPNFNSASDSPQYSVNAMNDFATKLNIVKNCGSDMGCLYNSPIKYLGGQYWYSNLDLAWNKQYAKAILADGTMMIIYIYNTNCKGYIGSYAGSPVYRSVCGSIRVDVNGASDPNQLGRDIFVFWITQTGIYARGIFNDSYGCDVDSSSQETSDGCAGKVLSEGAMNY